VKVVVTQWRLVMSSTAFTAGMSRDTTAKRTPPSKALQFNVHGHLLI